MKINGYLGTLGGPNNLKNVKYMTPMVDGGECCRRFQNRKLGSNASVTELTTIDPFVKSRWGWCMLVLRGVWYLQVKVWITQDRQYYLPCVSNSAFPCIGWISMGVFTPKLV